MRTPTPTPRTLKISPVLFDEAALGGDDFFADLDQAFDRIQMTPVATPKKKSKSKLSILCANDSNDCAFRM